MHAAVTGGVWDKWMVLFFPFPFNIFTQMSLRWMVCILRRPLLWVCAHVFLIVLELPSSLVWCGSYNQFNLVLTLRGCWWGSELCYLVIYVFWAYWKFEMTHWQKFCIISISRKCYLASWSISLCQGLFFFGICAFFSLLGSFFSCLVGSLGPTFVLGACLQHLEHLSFILNWMADLLLFFS